jgi:hypothetical protein
VDRLFPQEGEDVFLENADHLGIRAALPRLDFQLAPFHPVREYDTEGVLARLADGEPLLSMYFRIGAPGQHGACFVACLARLSEGDFRAGAQ